MHIIGKTYTLYIKTIWGKRLPMPLRYSGSFNHFANYCQNCHGDLYTNKHKVIKLYSFDDDCGARHSYCHKCLKRY